MNGLSPPHPARPWRHTPLLKLTYVVHAAAAGLVLLEPGIWPWLLGTLTGNHLLLTAAGLWPRSHALGPNWVRLPEAAIRANQIAITIDDGPDPEVTPQVLDLLDRYGVRVTFFCIGAKAAQHPDLCREIVRRGHAVENHSQNHYKHFSLLGPRGIEREINAGQDTLTGISGRRPHFFRPTAGLRNAFLEPVLARHGLHLASWTRRGYDTRNGDADAVAARLTRNLAAGDILLLHDGHAARTRRGVPVILEVLPRLLNAASAAGLNCVTLPAVLDSGSSGRTTNPG
jgi:peptidoglycan/xylan/chitin deacetylase (PgdA/CDA1 family)